MKGGKSWYHKFAFWYIHGRSVPLRQIVFVASSTSVFMIHSDCKSLFSWMDVSK